MKLIHAAHDYYLDTWRSVDLGIKPSTLSLSLVGKPCTCLLYPSACGNFKMDLHEDVCECIKVYTLYRRWWNARITSAKEVMFLPVFVCLSVCLCVSKITQKVMEGFFWNFEGMSGMAQTTSDSISGVIWKFELMLTRRAVNMLVC